MCELEYEDEMNDDAPVLYIQSYTQIYKTFSNIKQKLTLLRYYACIIRFTFHICTMQNKTCKDEISPS